VTVFDRGAILIEQLLAIALLGLLVVGTLGLLTTGALAAQMAQKASVASGLAARQLEALADACAEPAPVPRAPFDAVEFHDYEWQAHVTEVARGLCTVTVTVWWRVRGREYSLSLATLARRRVEP
jgi:type II secretory pathway pseudopilin PulG